MTQDSTNRDMSWAASGVMGAAATGRQAAASRMPRARPAARWASTAMALLLCAIAPAFGQLTDISQAPLNTYSAGSSVVVKPNVMFILDDSGSMDWDYMPDWANDSPSNYIGAATSPAGPPPVYYLRNSGFNGVAYNPAIRYLPPVSVTATGATDTTRFPSMNSANTSAWTAVRNDGFGVQFTGTSNLVSSATNANSAVFYTLVAGEYCDSPSLRNCITSNTPSGLFAYPAPLRWCNSTALTTCKATYDSDTGFVHPRAPQPRVSTLTVGNGNSTVVASIKVNGLEILSAATAASNNETNVATAIASGINACTNVRTGNCQTVGYIAYLSGTTVTILAPGGQTVAPVITKESGSMSISATAFATGVAPLLPFRLSATSAVSSAAIPGENYRTVITPAIDSYPYPGSTTKAATRTDCAGSVCTYAEEMTNYANWWAYYRTRMQMMKTSTSLAFAAIDTASDITNGVSQFRVGFMSINNNASAQFLNISDFSTTQKQTWYNKLFAAIPNNSTPLRQALANAGRIYGGRLNSLYGVTVVDPLQFSCQKNFTILSTDGYWNGSAGVRLDGTTAIGNQDGMYAGAYGDGATSAMQQQTSTLQQRTSQQTAIVGTLQSTTSKLQTGTTNLLRRTFSGGAWSSWQVVSSCSPARNQTECSYEATTTWADTAANATCRIQAKGKNNEATWYTETSCRYVVANVNPAAQSCNPVAQSTGTTNGTVYSVNPATACTYNFTATPVGTPSCSPAYVANDFTNPTVYQSCKTTVGTWVDATAPGCTVTTTPDGNGRTTQCQYTAWSTWANAPSCVPQAQSTASPFSVLRASACRYSSVGGTSDSLADVAAYYYYTDLRTDSATVPTADRTGTCNGPVIAPNTTPNNLCANNVAPSGIDTNPQQHMTTFTLGLGAQGKMVYSQYQNDSSGNRVYVPNYWDQRSGDFYDVNAGSTPNATAGVCPWMSSGKCTWPTPSTGSIANIDDLWHAAVNGRGSYFSAADPTSLSTALTSTLRQIASVPRPGAAAAAASSNPNISSTDNFIFSSSYRSVEWWGDMIRQQLNPDGSLSDQQWSAMQMLDCATTPWRASTLYSVGQVFGNGNRCYLVGNGYTSGATFDELGVDSANTIVLTGAPVTRRVFTANDARSALIPFAWGSLSSSQQAFFTAPAITWNQAAATGLSQFCSGTVNCLSSTKQSSNTIASGGRAGEALVRYLAGDRTYEGVDFRSRVHVLGDIVSSEARYVQTPLFGYADAGYSEFKALQANRASAVYVAANDGMLHAFNASTGTENWAYIPSAILPQLHRLADQSYGDNHRFMVDGSPEIGDICPTAPTTACSGAQWRTILVGGLSAGGASYYALDVTNPTSPSLLWEFNHSTLGASFSNPRITKLRNGTWVVILSSGYNNADGVGRLYVLNAFTGQLMTSINGNGIISTGVGTASQPSGLNRIAADVQYPMVDNTAQAIYGGDVLGNLWRFDINNTIGAAGHDAQRLVTFVGSDGLPQPITSKPVIASINGKPVVFVGTGVYLGTRDVSTTTSQSFYAVKDNYGSTSFANPRSAGSGFVQQTLANAPCPSGADPAICTPGQTVRTSSNNTVNWTVNNGWFIDFPTGGERSVTDASLGLGTLAFTTVRPQQSSADPCGSGGADNSTSYVYFLNYLTGSAVTGASGVAGVSLGIGVATRPVLVKQADGSVRALIRQSAAGSTSGTDQGRTSNLKAPVMPSVAGSIRRVSWRELNGR